ncbi:thioredoxin reductase [Halalkalibacter hemicellulosilyticusJCM 9152]|uniref:Thioredoxin reductase n=1 Tax=Halalkalibacter hemicellulosilyticusJCM 9152 TaxID=1236971 RepID=W4QF86_9BACI|nr:thioredoxin reductase [Halalkalibacter hemicellulosilyticusJCM 9152]
MSDSTNMYDITIIGGGPTGLFAAFYGGMRQAKVKIIESMPQLGGQLSALYPEKYIYDVAGFPKVRAQELVDRLAEQASQFNPTIVLEQSVQELIKQEDESYIIQTDKDTHFTKAVIITAGAGAFQPRRLEVEGASNYEGKNLHYFIQDLSAFAGKRVIVCGEGIPQSTGH